MRYGLTWCEPPSPTRHRQIIRCYLCGDRLHKIAHAPTDEYHWADQDGSLTGLDTDLRPLVDGNPYARLAVLAETMERTNYRDHRAAQEYITLATRMNFTGMHHVHHVASRDLHPYVGDVPEHCGMPMWLRPSGWHCRECRARS